MSTEAFFAVVTVPALVGSGVLGLMIGALYAWDTHAEPWTLWAVGLAFVVLQAMLGAFERDGLVSFGLGRAVLWSELAGCVWLGKHGRQWIALRTTRKRLEQLRKERDDGR